MNSFILWLAQGGGSGRIPHGPGTFGSLVGMLWFCALLLPGSPWIFAAGVLASVFLSVWVCGRAEIILGQEDPGSVVLDEIIAIPLCFAWWLGVLFFQKGIWPGAAYFFTGRGMLMTAAVFVLFRIADIAKPWPVSQSQSLHGGWGVTLDDVLAALYVNVVLALAWWWRPEWFGEGSERV